MKFVVAVAKNAESAVDSESRGQVLTALAQRMLISLKSAHFNNFISVLYLIIKSLNLANVIGQFLLLNSFLGSSYAQLWGYEILKDLINGREWNESGHFPRVTLCDVEVYCSLQYSNDSTDCKADILLPYSMKFHTKLVQYEILWKKISYCPIAV